jgi:hypothetical protein
VATVKSATRRALMQLDDCRRSSAPPEFRAAMERLGGDCGDLQARIKELETRLKDLEKKLQK